LHYSEELTEKGFVFAPFDSDQVVLFPEDKCEVFCETMQMPVLDWIDYEDALPAREVADFHVALVENGIKAIEEGSLEKVVLSRREEVAIDKEDETLYYQRILQTYPQAFRYWWYHPAIGMWMGATPEQLLKNNQGTIKTVALAGTQLYLESESVEWAAKEKEEQVIVTDFIETSLMPYVNKLTKTTPYTFRAGNLVHIKTDIEADLICKTDFIKAVKALHPTPALCGFPKQNAKDFILANEGYQREYYSGYLGEINYDYTNKQADCSDLFVNLRCMQLKDTAFLYIGGGITRDSDPEKEFIETINKSKTMKRVLGKIER